VNGLLYVPAALHREDRSPIQHLLDGGMDGHSLLNELSHSTYVRTCVRACVCVCMYMYVCKYIMYGCMCVYE
jgi:hypothetical protein